MRWKKEERWTEGEVEEMLVLREQDNLTMAEIGIRLNRTVDSVRMKLYRMRNARETDSRALVPTLQPDGVTAPVGTIKWYDQNQNNFVKAMKAAHPEIKYGK